MPDGNPERSALIGQFGQLTQNPDNHVAVAGEVGYAKTMIKLSADPSLPQETRSGCISTAKQRMELGRKWFIQKHLKFDPEAMKSTLAQAENMCRQQNISFPDQLPSVFKDMYEKINNPSQDMKDYNDLASENRSIQNM